MLSPVERNLVQRDQALPGLEKLLHAEAFRDSLAAASGASIAEAKLHYLRYKPEQNCLAAFTLQVGDTTVECHAKAYRPQDIAKLEKAESRSNHAGPLGFGRFVWPHAGIEVCIFPNDNKLPALPLMAEADLREDFLRRHLPNQPDVWQSSVRPLAYKPERRWVGALESAGSARAVCKLYGANAFEVARQNAKGFASGELFKLPPLLGRSKGRCALFFGWQEGELLSTAMLAPHFPAGALQKIGSALREFQSHPAAWLSARSTNAVAQVALDQAEFLSFILPAETSRATRIAAKIAAALTATASSVTTIHGDFYAKQILLASERISLLDLDEAALGDPLTDLGSFIAHLEREVIAGRLSAGRCAEYSAALVKGYESSSGPIDETRLKTLIAERLFARATDFFRTHETHWPELTATLLTRVESLLPSPSANRTVATLDEKLPQLESALAPMQIESHLAEVLMRGDRQITTVSVEQAKLRRHKIRRRALIEYSLEVQRGAETTKLKLLGKMRRRGVDMESLSALHTLTAERFAANANDRISIPRIIGTLPAFQLTLQPLVRGRALGELLRTEAGATVARRVADALHKLHRSEMTLTQTHTIADELDILEARLTTLAATRTAWTSRLVALLDSCRKLAANLPIVSPRLVHRDFYHDQLLVDGDRVWLLDLDLLCAGDPALDAGNFIGHLIEWAVRKPSNRDALSAAQHAFRERFLELSGGDRADAVEIYTTLTLARHVSISTQFPERAPFTEAILTLCETRCREANYETPIPPFS